MNAITLHVTSWHCDEVHDLSSFTDDTLEVCQAADCRVLAYQGDMADGANARDLTPISDGFEWTRR